MGVVEQELEKLELSIGEHRLLALVAQYPTIWINPKALQFPDSLVPKVETFVVPRHLTLDIADVNVGRSLGHWVQVWQLPLHAVKRPSLKRIKSS